MRMTQRLRRLIFNCKHSSDWMDMRIRWLSFCYFDGCYTLIINKRSKYIPNDHISVDLSYLLPNSNSGDIQKGVPIKLSFSAYVYYNSALTPKSASFVLP